EHSAWTSDDPLAIAFEAIACGVHDVLLLDVSRVGTGSGPGTERLFSEIRQAHPEVSISLGGGISRVEEILELKEAGAASVLVGSAIHDGRIGRAELGRVIGSSHDVFQSFPG